MTQDDIQRSAMVTCANGHPCNGYVTTCRVCGASVANRSHQSPRDDRVAQDYIQGSASTAAVVCDLRRVAAGQGGHRAIIPCLCGTKKTPRWPRRIA